jgi:hypothetical protein
MSICRSPSLAVSTASAATSPAGGSKDSACAPKTVGPARKLTPKATSRSDPAGSPEHISGYGTLPKRPPSSTECAIHEPSSIRRSGNIGQEILDQGGKIIAWTTDAWIAQEVSTISLPQSFFCHDDDDLELLCVRCQWCDLLFGKRLARLFELKLAA